MREHSRDKERLEHILAAIGIIENGLETYSKEELLNNRLLYYGLVKQIEIIGEAANMLTHEFRDTHTEVDWFKKSVRDIRAFRVENWSDFTQFMKE